MLTDADTTQMSLRESMKMDKSKISIVSLFDPSDETEYWKSQSSQARLEALELMRQVMYGYDPSTDRLQRFLEVVEQERR